GVNWPELAPASQPAAGRRPTGYSDPARWLAHGRLLAQAGGLRYGQKVGGQPATCQSAICATASTKAAKPPALASGLHEVPHRLIEAAGTPPPHRGGGCRSLHAANAAWTCSIPAGATQQPPPDAWQQPLPRRGGTAKAGGDCKGCSHRTPRSFWQNDDFVPNFSHIL
ncbi:hypothetical protein BHE74_00029393, partial [Ensete ventricosum]